MEAVFVFLNNNKSQSSESFLWYYNDSELSINFTATIFWLDAKFQGKYADLRHRIFYEG